MTDEMRCRWMGSDNPRAIIGRHNEDCADETCRGCEPCTRAHCRVCAVKHVAGTGTCPDCLDEVRTNLGEIQRKCDDLRTEVEHRGIDGEAMNLLGPVADPDAWGHHVASVNVGRIPPEWLEAADNELHPLWVSAWWSSAYREAFDHDEPTGRVVLGDELGYLSRNLNYAADYEDVPFEDFARDVRRCVAHLENVLGDSERGERTNIDCLDCGSPLERRLGAAGFDDLATCRGCKRRYTGPEYQFAVKRTYIFEAEWLTDVDMVVRTGIKAETVRSWARTPKDDSPPLVAKDVQLGRTVYCVADVQQVAKLKGLAA